MDRIERLKAMIEHNPHDAFPRYGLAMEYKNQGKYEEAIPIFEKLLQDHPEYTAAYFHFGISLKEAGQEEKAGKIFMQGIKVAERQGEAHTRDELNAALAGLVSK